MSKLTEAKSELVYVTALAESVSDWLTNEANILAYFERRRKFDAQFEPNTKDTAIMIAETEDSIKRLTAAAKLYDSPKFGRKK